VKDLRTVYVLKFGIGMAAAFIFWFLAILVFMVYAFMPVSKMLNQIIFTITFPVIYLVIMNLLLRKLFSEKGWRNILINTGILIGSAALSLLVLDKGKDIADSFFR